MPKVVGKAENHIHKCTCKKCASVIEYTRSEESSYDKSDYGGGTTTYYTIRCPKCNNDIVTRCF